MSKFKFADKIHKELKNLGGNKKRAEKFAKQYAKTGIAPTDMWCMDVAFAVWIVPRLKIFRGNPGGIPGSLMSEGVSESEAIDAWNSILDNMIIGFEFMTQDSYFNHDPEEGKKVTLAFKLFAEHAQNLWY